MIGARGNTPAVLIWSKQIAAARRVSQMVIWIKAKEAGGQDHVAPSESQLDSWVAAKPGELFREGPRRSWKGPSPTQLNFASQSVTTTYQLRS